VARTVFFHIGLPKTGTTYLQTILWNNRDRLREQGVLLPGRSPREHLWASAVVREDPRISRRDPQAAGAWQRIVAAVNDWPETALVSHEFFAAASEEQARRAVAALARAEVHVVLTARDTLGLLTARWQEFVKNGSTRPVDAYPGSEATDPHNEWDWGTMDAADVLRRWGAGLPADRVHVITLPKPDEPRDLLWRRFAELVGIDPDGCDTSGSEQNESLGVVEVELLRRVNARLTGFDSAFDRGVWVRGYLAQGKLVPRGGDKFWPAPRRVEELRERGRRTVDAIRYGGYHVIGDVEDLLTPETLPERRHPDSVTDAEVAQAAVDTVAVMLGDVRRLTQELKAARRQLRRSATGGSVRRTAARLRRAAGRRLRRLPRR
jgi:hypothetical protein